MDKGQRAAEFVKKYGHIFGADAWYWENEITRLLDEHERELSNAKTNVAQPEAVLVQLGEAATKELAEAAIAFHEWLTSKDAYGVDIPDAVWNPFSSAVDKYEAVSA